MGWEWLVGIGVGDGGLGVLAGRVLGNDLYVGGFFATVRGEGVHLRCPCIFGCLFHCRFQSFALARK